jgi:hypothetical protein
MTEQELHRLWRDQPAVTESFDPQELRRRSDRLRHTVGKRNVREYLAGAAASLAFAWFAVSAHDAVTQLGCLATIAGIAIALYQLHRRTATAEPDPAQLGTPVAVHYRAELCRQRDALRSVWLWYLAPMLPGPEIMLLGQHLNGRAAGGFHDLVALLLIPTLALLVLWLNAYGASRIQRRIDELDRNLTETTK